MVRFRGRSADPRLRGQRGESLVESIAGLVILSTVVLGGVVLLLTIVKASRTQEAIARTSNEATVAAEFVDRLTYVPCAQVGGQSTPTAATYENTMNSGPQAYVAPSGLSFTLSVEAVTYLDDASDSTADFVSACPSSGDQGAQRLAVRITGEDANGPLSSDLFIVKRNDLCTGVSGAVEGQTC